MTRIITKKLILTAAGSLFLAACGGGGGSTPAPTTPTLPTSNDSLDDIQVSEDFNSFSSIVLVKVEGATETVDSSNQTQSSDAVVGVNTDGSFEVTISGQGDDNDVNFDFTFTSAMRTVGTEKTVFQSSNTAFSLLRPGVDVSIPFTQTGETINMSYVTYGQWAKTDGTIAANGFDSARGYVIFGVRTDSVPTTGTATYAGAVEGIMFKPTATAGSPEVWGISGRVDIDVDFAAANNNVVATFSKMAQSVVGTTNDWVNFTMTSDLSNGLFSGAASNFTDAGSGAPVAGYSGTVSGAFYGPNAQEIGGTWSVAGPGEEAAGAFVGEQ
ncbi:transferrin-binding protein-like solute binding protein [Emcibacter sp.]|uniref:transferrin-binding protein-like solute binding protein n=1 Tax=Emcibacter sp. TaxID=1979954 RepID=UPI002AA8666D|nr:transferrin-binding protein-like solute binding protein [Emcibacter sp.]